MGRVFHFGVFVVWKGFQVAPHLENSGHNFKEREEDKESVLRSD